MGEPQAGWLFTGSGTEVARLAMGFFTEGQESKWHGTNLDHPQWALQPSRFQCYARVPLCPQLDVANDQRPIILYDDIPLPNLIVKGRYITCNHAVFPAWRAGSKATRRKAEGSEGEGILHLQPYLSCLAFPNLLTEC